MSHLLSHQWMGSPKTTTANIQHIRHLALHLLQNPIKTIPNLKKLHVWILKTQLHSTSYAIGNFASHCSALGLMDYACKLFDHMIEPNGFVWNTMIRGFQRNHQSKHALVFFHRMRRRNVLPDRFTYPFVIKSCAQLKDLQHGKTLHGQIFKSNLDFDVYIQTSLIDFYGNCGKIRDAHQVFDEMPERDVVSWTVMMSVYVDLFGDMTIARQLFDRMPVKDLAAWNTMIGGYVKIGEMGAAGKLFCRVERKDLLLCNIMLGGYAKNGDMDVMLQLFDEMPERDLVSWNTMIGGLVQGGRINEAMGLFYRMQVDNLRPNEVTIMSILSACAKVGALDIGRWMHSYIDRDRFGLNLMVSTALVDMYSKCGALESAQQVFDQMVRRDEAAWNAMIMGFAMNGRSKDALEFFYRMKSEGNKPNEVTMIGVLCACTHGGLIDEGRRCFDAMSHELGIAPKIEHYGCMVDLLGRAGLLNEAYEFIQGMPIEPHSGVWGALLGACKIHGNVELAEYAMKHLLELDQEDGGYLAILSNIYANAGRWGDVAKVRDLMREKGVYKMPGCSSIEVNGKVHEFGVGDKTHPQSKEINEMLDEISKQLRIAGHVASTAEVFFDVEEEEKEHALSFHSERLAIAFGLISTKQGATIRVVKNLRVCVDCHNATKLISIVFDREIIVRDHSRFHHFKKGSCSCGDYW